MNYKDKFKAVLCEWYDYVSRDHHKDVDCHFYIGQETEYSYNGIEGVNEWVARHNGYITEFEYAGQSEEQVMEKAIKHLKDKMLK